jgi:hypothetical protein
MLGEGITGDIMGSKNHPSLVLVMGQKALLYDLKLEECESPYQGLNANTCCYCYYAITVPLTYFIISFAYTKLLNFWCWILKPWQKEASI